MLAGSPVGVAARLCSQHGVLLSKPAADALVCWAGLRTVPVFLQGSGFLPGRPGGLRPGLVLV